MKVQPNLANTVYRQSEREHIYNPLIEQLIAEDKAYKCYMTEEVKLKQNAKRNVLVAKCRTSGQHAHLTQEQRDAEAEGRTLLFVSVFQRRNLCF